ncbi:type II secretion system F family protein [Prosthecochloris ethylica]|uniref:type II secretion system F family protein n=1 Tax=Prosthecochloris ethylica TaxID=2743976 RepID=UPI003B830ADB
MQRADSPISTRRVTLLVVVLFTAVAALGILRQGNLFFVLVLGAAIACTPILWLLRNANQRRKAFEDKLPETLDYISRALRAGHSLTSALAMIGKEFPAPIGQEFKTVSDEMAFGIPFKNAIGRLADRIRSNDLNFFVISLMIQHETGGNLTELLDGLASTIRERVKLRGKVRTLSSEGRTSAWVLGSMPFVMTAIITVINPRYISVLWSTPQGHTLLLIAGGLMVAGVFVLQRIIRIKV